MSFVILLAYATRVYSTILSSESIIILYSFCISTPPYRSFSYYVLENHRTILLFSVFSFGLICNAYRACKLFVYEKLSTAMLLLQIFVKSVNLRIFSIFILCTFIFDCCKYLMPCIIFIYTRDIKIKKRTAVSIYS